MAITLRPKNPSYTRASGKGEPFSLTPAGIRMNRSHLTPVAQSTDGTNTVKKRTVARSNGFLFQNLATTIPASTTHAASIASAVFQIVIASGLWVPFESNNTADMYPAIRVRPTTVVH